jgi:hypothetical protein
MATPYFDLKSFNGILRLIVLPISTYGVKFAMNRHTKAPWHVKKKAKYYAVYSENTPLALVLPNYIKDKNAAEANAYLFATAPQLLSTLKKVLEHLDNCMIVTCDGFKTDDSSLRASIADAIMRGEGYRL